MYIRSRTADLSVHRKIELCESAICAENLVEEREGLDPIAPKVQHAHFPNIDIN